MPLKRVAGLAIAVAAVLAIAAGSILHVPEGDVSVVSWRGGGTPDLRTRGWSFRLPFFQSARRYPGGVVSVQGTLAAASKEGSSIDLPYSARVRPDSQELLSLHRAGGSGGAPAALRTLVEEPLRKGAAATGTYDLASGSANESLAAAVRAALEDRLGSQMEFTLGTPVAPAAVRASFERQATFGRRVETGAHILLVGIDGGDWDLIDPMIAEGRLPNLARLKRQGAWARLRSSVPTLSPLLWTTVATGKTPDRHGINDFLVADPRTGRQVPINSTFRKTKAIWNILTEAGLTSDVIAWWATWPAETVRGHLVSDRVAYSTFDLSAPRQKQGAVYPPDYASTIETLRVTTDAVSYGQIARFVHITPGEFKQARAASTRHEGVSEIDESINVLTRVLASTETYRRIALDLLGRASRDDGPSRLFAVYFQGVDEVNHRFAHCAPPRTDLCTEGDYRRFKDAVSEFYVYQDAILGEILKKAGDRTVIVMSDHGFSSGSGRPRDVKPFIEGRPGLWHDMAGIFIAHGPLIKPGEIPVVTLFDIAPSLLYLLGLPVPEDMPGNVIEAAVADDFASAHPVMRVPSYEVLQAGPGGGAIASASAPEGGGAPADGGAVAAAGGGDAAENEMVEQLRALGYVGGSSGSPAAAGGGAPPAGTAAPARDGGGAPGGVPTLLFHTNLGSVHLAKRQFDQAEAEFQKALRIDPGSIAALSGMSLLEEAKGNLDQALAYLQTVVRLEKDDDLPALLKIAELSVRMGRPADGLAYLKGLEPGHSRGGPREVGLRVAFGMLYSALGRPREAESALRRALAIDTASVVAMQELFALLDGQGRSSELQPLLQAALLRNPRSAMHHNWMGLVLRRKGDLQGARLEFEKTLETAPDLVGAMANLGSLDMQQGRLEEATAVLGRALAKEPRNVESRTNLIVAQGMRHDLEAARGLVKEAEGLGMRVPLFYNGLAYALHINGRSEEALDVLRESFKIDPRQADARRLQAEIEQGRPLNGLPYR
jgi:predicted AlkP superfamily phosphohydrolase/phosphomutase/tetratricopeptide (TPR) repeat protein